MDLSILINASGIINEINKNTKKKVNRMPEFQLFWLFVLSEKYQNSSAVSNLMGGTKK